MSAVEEQFRRTVFNIVARNQDDHVKNIAFLMDRRGVWRLSPAYDVAYAYNPAGTWTREHQMSVAGKRDEGLRRGMQEGMQQDRVEGERVVLERLLRRRFGQLSPATAERLGRASAADLETWAENVLDAERLGDVFG